MYVACYQSEEEEEKPKTPTPRITRQIFLFSATLMLSTEGRIQDKKSHKKKSKNLKERPSMMEELQGKLYFRGKPYIVDLSTQRQVRMGASLLHGDEKM